MQLDYLSPDYTSVYRKRADMVRRLNTMSARDFAALKAYYRDGRIADFISDFGMTVNPKNTGTSIPVVMPFVLFPKQREWIDFVYRKFMAKQDGLTEKSRDIGISWLAMGFSVSMCLLGKNIAIGFGSAKEENVDASGDPDSLFYKGRMFAQNLPRRFKGDWDIASKACSSHRHLMFPATESTIVGKSGDNIGRGGRTAIFFVDESAHLERPKMVDAALAANTDCRQDMSSVNGMANSFAELRHSGRVEVFTFSWRDDPRRDEEWAAKKRASLDPVVWNAEYQLNYNASVEGVIIPFEWIEAAVGLHDKLGIAPGGRKLTALDIADIGRDKNALAGRHGNLLTHMATWSGQNSDLLATTAKAYMLCDEWGISELLYDADGMGAGMKGFDRAINEERTKAGKDGRPLGRKISASKFQGSGSPLFPERKAPRTERTNEDYFQNRKAQAWYALRERFYNAYLASTGQDYDADNIIYIVRDLPLLSRLMPELSQPVWKPTASGKLLVDKTPDDTLSPNLADSVMMLFSPAKPTLHITDEILSKV